MIPELEKARVTELQVRMDCNGCVQRIKRAMHSVDGVYDINIDLAGQKLTVVGTAEPEKIVKAIKKTRKIATICSHTEAEPPPPPPAEPAPDAASQQPPSAEPPKEDAAAATPPQDNNEVKPSPEAKEVIVAVEPVETKVDTGQVRMVHHYPYELVNREQWSRCCYHPQRHGGIAYQPPYYVHHSYSIYGASPYEEDRYYRYRRGVGGDRSQITSAFSEENPNACGIV